VLDLYMFLSRAYRADPHNPDLHDRVYAFGFSRGAFTARVLAPLVGRVGLSGRRIASVGQSPTRTHLWGTTPPRVRDDPDVLA
jgi:uncharacterized protein (DUF2235 family)